MRVSLDISIDLPLTATLGGIGQVYDMYQRLRGLKTARLSLYMRYCPQSKPGPYSIRPVVPLAYGASVISLGSLAVDKSFSDGAQLLLFKDPAIGMFPERDMTKYVRITTDRVLSNGEPNTYLALPGDLLEDHERYRGIRPCCQLCKRRCPEKAVRSKTHRVVASKQRLINYVLTKKSENDNLTTLEKVSSHMAKVGRKGGLSKSPARIESARRASIIRWDNYRRVRNKLKEPSEAIRFVAQ